MSGEKLYTLFEDSDLSALPSTDPGSGKPWIDPVSHSIIVGALGTFGLTQSAADARYLQLSGGTLTGTLTVPSPLRFGSSAQRMEWTNAASVQIVSNDTYLVGFHGGISKVSIGPNALVGGANTNYNTDDVSIIRSAVNQWDVRANTTRFRNSANSGDGAISAGAGTFTGTVITTDIRPDADGARALGSSSFQYNAGWFKNLDVQYYLTLSVNGMLRFGGSTSSFPGLKRNATSVEVRLADDSAAGNLSAANITGTGSFSLGNNTTALIRDNAGNFEVCSFSTIALAVFRNTGITIGVNLAPMSAGTKDLANTSNPWQNFYQRGENVNYNVGFLGGSNYERGYQRWNSNVYEIGTENAGTGTIRALAIKGALETQFWAIGVNSMTVTGSDVRFYRGILFPADNTYDIGASGASRPRDLFVGRNLTVSGAFNLAPITKATLLASTPNAATGGRWRVTDSTPANREAYPDGTNWRWASDDTVVV